MNASNNDHRVDTANKGPENLGRRRLLEVEVSKKVETQ
jgi:hypothetical protein